MKKLHSTQQRLLDLLKENTNEPLTIRELKFILGLSSTSLVAHHIDRLEKLGYIKRDPYNPQNYNILDSPESDVAYLNIYGLAQCGPNGTILDDSPIDRIAISSRLINVTSSNGFIVKAKGDSMEPEIHSGDLVIARKTKVIERGRPMVCVNDGQALIKIVIFDDKNPDTIVLQSSNSKTPPFVASSDFRVEGLVVGLIKNKFKT